MKNRKKILITGVAGFLGSHLADRFMKEDYIVYGMDNLITGDMDNIAHLMPEKDFFFHILSETELIELIALFFHMQIMIILEECRQFLEM